MKKFIIENWPWIAGTLIPVVWSEWLGLNHKYKSNSIIELIQRIYIKFFLKK